MYTFRGFVIPDYMMDGINRYVNEGIKPGRFLTAIICNNLSDAVGYADDNNLPNIPAFVSYFYNEAPGYCWGSPKQMEAWMLHKKLEKENKKIRDA